MLRVAIVGAGPSGIYAADKLLRGAAVPVEVELFDRLPTPWGLVRSGVAPDHPKIKSVTRVFERTAALPDIRFHGGVEVGTAITHDELLKHHHAVIYAYGTAQGRQLALPGEHLAGCHPATDFVAWYNGHPDAAGLSFALDHPRAVVVGNGNVALDVARMLVLDQAELASTDIADHALRALRASAVKEVVILGRRGPAQAAYTLPELRELGELTGVDIQVDGALDATDDLGSAQSASVSLVQEYARRPATAAPRQIVLRFLTAPVEVVGDGRVQGLRVVRTELVHADDGTLSARPTGEHELLDCGLVLSAIGYRGAALPGLPFDRRAGTIPNTQGRVTPGTYVAGWIKRGPEGVIGTNKRCASETVAALLEDHAAGLLDAPAGGARELDALLRRHGVKRVDHAGWEQIDRHEQDLGARVGRPRVKLTDVEAMLAVAGADR